MTRTCLRLAVVLGAALLALAGCADVPVPHDGAAATTSPSPTTTPVPVGDTTALAKATAEAVQDYWRTTFPETFGKPWTDLHSFQAAHPRRPGSNPPPCVDDPHELADQAFYCPQADAIVWDADGLFPGLARTYGPAGVAMVLAHETGHAVQNRLGVQDAQEANPGRYPTILLEAQADCYAGATFAHFEQVPVAGRTFGPADRDQALLAMAKFRDPLGVVPADRGAHGNAFDRVSAFQDGYLHGPRVCDEMSIGKLEFTQRRFGSRADAARQGNLPMAELLEALGPDVQRWFTAAGGKAAHGWQAPPVRQSPSGACPTEELLAQGPAQFCAVDGSVSDTPAALAAVHQQLGDYADGTLIVSRYGLALRTAIGLKPVGSLAGEAAVCWAGAFTGSLLASSGGGFGLSPGDIDEAIEVLIKHDWAARDAHGNATPGQTGFTRVGIFRRGFEGGPDMCSS